MGVHGDILDSSVLKQLKFGAVDTSNNVFRLFANISPAIFWISSALVIASAYIGDPIKCMTDKKIAETVCWLHGTYHVGESISEEVYGGKVCSRSYDTYGSDLTTEERDADTPYYQWVAFMLFIHGVIFLISARIWEVLENGLLEQFGTRKEINKLVEDEEISKKAEQNAKRFLQLSRNANNRYLIYFVFCEIANILALVFNFCLIDVFLGGRFKYYGSEVVGYSLNNDDTAENPMCSAFPTLTMCRFNAGGVVLNSVDKISTLCVLSQNIINQKIYLFLWFWMILLMVACAINSLYRIALIALPAMRKYELVWLINTKRKRGKILDNDNVVRHNWQEFNKIGTWFLMCQIGRNSNPYYFRQFLQSLVDREMEKNKKSSCRSANGTEDRNSDIEEGSLKKPLF